MDFAALKGLFCSSCTPLSLFGFCTTHTHTHTHRDTDTHARTHTHTGHILAVMQVITLFRFKIQSSQIDLFGIGLLTGQVLLLETERRVSIHRKIGPSPLSVSVSVSSVNVRVYFLTDRSLCVIK